jgi:diguanylate cyclase (GGDEF)-like protein
MGHEPSSGLGARDAHAVPDSGAGAPRSVESALRRLRIVAGLLVGARLVSSPEARDVVAWPLLAGIAASLVAVNGLSLVGDRNPGRVRRALGATQLVADSALVLLVLWVRPADSPSVDWAILVLPVLEGAVRYQLPGAIASWSVLAIGYAGWNHSNDELIEYSELAQRLTVVLLVALPSGFLAQQLVAEIAAHRRGRDDAERRGSLLRAAALGGRRSTTLDVDEILDVLRETIAQMGFRDPLVFEIDGPTRGGVVVARPVRHSSDVVAIPPGDARLDAAVGARDARRLVLSAGAGAAAPARTAPAAPVVATPVAIDDDGTIVVTARWPDAGAPPAAQRESLELFAAQAGAALRNAQVHRELGTLKDRLAHEAAHDALTDLPNRRRFHEELERVCGRGRPGDTLAVLFLDLDGFKDVNDRHGHDVGNELLVHVAKRLRDCVRPGDVVARMGGDEFTILLTRLESAAPAVEIADRICEMLVRPFRLGDAAVTISTSIGIALAPSGTADPGDLVRRADGAMYRAKRAGKAGWAMDSGSLDAAGA